jgi:predicted MFS family arabinose efflux permease
LNSSKLSSKQIGYLILLAAVNFTHIMDFMIMMPMAPQLMRVLEINPQEFSILVASYIVAAGTASFLGTFFVDRFDRKKVLLFCYAGFIVGTLLCGLMNSYVPLLLARIFTGLLGGIIGSQVLSIVGDLVSAENRGKATGVVMTGFSAASVLGVPLGLFCATQWGWEFPFFGISFVGIVVWLLVLDRLPPIQEHLKNASGLNPLGLLKSIFSVKSHNWALLFTVLVAFSHFTLIPFLSPYMVSNVGFKELELSYIYIIGGGLTLFTGPLIGKLADRFGTVRIFTWLILFACIPQYFISNLGHASSGLALFFTSLFFIFSGGRFVPSQALTIGAVKPHLRGGFMSLNSSVMQMASGLASFLAGLVVVKNGLGQLEHYDVLGYSTMIFSLLSILIAEKLKKSSSD